MELIELTVERKRFSSYHIETTLRTKDGKVKARYPNMLNQIKRGTKTVIINNWEYSLNWENVPSKKRAKKN